MSSVPVLKSENWNIGGMLKGFPGLPQSKRTKSGRKMDMPNMMRTPENRSFSVL